MRASRAGKKDADIMQASHADKLHRQTVQAK